MWGVTLVLLSGAKPSVLFTNVATYLKVALILVLIVAGLAMGMPQPVSFAPSSADLSYIISAPFAISLMWVMYSYSGWNAATYIADEIKDPPRTLPRALVAGVVIVMLLYVGLNAVFLYTTPMDKLAGQVNVGLIAGEHIFGVGGGRIVGALICFGLISAITAMMWIGPRVTMVMGEDLSALSYFAKRSAAGVPARALVLQLGVATALVLTQKFKEVVEFVQFGPLSCSLLAVAGVIAPGQAANLAAAVSGLGLSVNPVGIRRGDGVHPGLSDARKAVAIVGQHRNHGDRPDRFRPVVPASTPSELNGARSR